MNISILVENTERKNFIEWSSFTKDDVITSQVDSLNFKTKKYGVKTWKPAVGDEVIVYDGSDKIFGGYIIKINEIIKGAGILEYSVQCKDYTYEMDRSLVIDSYSGKTVAQIIADINTNYLPAGFTTANVDCNLTIDYIAFNYEQPSKCIQQLADLVNYYWYVDYDKDIHFFPKIGELAPFELNDTNGNYVFNSLRIKEDLSQLKNYVFVRGGEYEATRRSESYKADGKQDTINLAYKYSSKPGVDIDGTQKVIGTDGLNTFDGSYDFMWNYNGKYIVASGVIPDGNIVTISGLPLFPVISRSRDTDSIATYGESRYKIIDKSINTKKAARDRGKAELKAFSNPLKVGSFQTYTSGLRSGQLISITSTIRGMAETKFIIQKVNLKMIGSDKGLWTIEIVSVKKYGIIDFLQELLLAENKKIKINKNEILEVLETIEEQISITELISKHTEATAWESMAIAEQIRKNPWTAIWVLGDYSPTDDSDPKRPMLLDRTSFLS